MREVLLAIIFFLASFSVFHLTSSPSSSPLALKRLKPEDFNVSIGKSGGRMSFILTGDPKTLNPVVAQETTSTAVIGDLFSGLTKMDLKEMKVVPDLAQSWEELDGGKRYIFKLRDGLRWSDGTPLTADDVVFTYRDVYLNKEIPNSTADMLRGILRTEQDMKNFVK